MDIGKAFSYVFEDERWLTKVLIGGLIAIGLFIPIVNFVSSFLLLGYLLSIASNVAQGNPRPLPEWTDFGDLLKRGLHAFLIYLVYFIPYLVIYGLFICLTGVMTGFSNQSDTSSASSASTAAASGIGLLSCLILPVIFLVALACTTVAYAAMARYVAHNNTLGEAFKFSEVISTVRSRPGPWLMLLLVGFLAGLASMVGLIACGVGILFTLFYSMCVQGHALGQTLAAQGMVPSYTQTPPPGVTPPSYDPPPSYQ